MASGAGEHAEKRNLMSTRLVEYAQTRTNAPGERTCTVLSVVSQQEYSLEVVITPPKLLYSLAPDCTQPSTAVQVSSTATRELPDMYSRNFDEKQKRCTTEIVVSRSRQASVLARMP